MDVLVVDDEEEIIDGIRRNLKIDGYSVAGASDREGALEAVRKRPYGVIFLDIKFPDVSGLELLKQIKEVRPLANVIMITGYSSLENVIECMREGAVDYFTKPLDMDELTKRMEQIHEKISRWEQTVGIEEIT